MTDPHRPVIVRASELLRLRLARWVLGALLAAASLLASAAGSRAYTQRQYVAELAALQAEQRLALEQIRDLQARQRELAETYAAEARRLQAHGDLLVSWGEYVRERLDLSRQNRGATQVRR